MEQKCFELIFDDGILSLIFIGEPDRHQATDARFEIDQKIHELRPCKIIMDISTIEDITVSTTLTLIVGRSQLAKELGIEFSLKNPSSKVKTFLKSVGVKKIW